VVAGLRVAGVEFAVADFGHCVSGIGWDGIGALRVDGGLDLV
jgi:hypothetical protein